MEVIDILDQTLTIISYDELDRRVVAQATGSVSDVYECLERTTESLEQQRAFWVEDQQLDKHTLVRKFATVDQGHIASLIVVGGMASKVCYTFDNH